MVSLTQVNVLLSVYGIRRWMSKREGREGRTVAYMVQGSRTLCGHLGPFPDFVGV